MDEFSSEQVAKSVEVIKTVERLNQNFRSSSRFHLLLILLLFGVLFVSVFFFFNKINSIQDTIVKNGSTIVSTHRSPAQKGDEREAEIYSLNARLKSLETLQGSIADTSKSAFEQMYYVFTIIAAFFGLFSLFFAYRQIKTDAASVGHDQEMRSLVSSFQENISSISSLILALKESFEYRSQIQQELEDIQKRALVLETDSANANAALRIQIDSLNTRSVDLFSSDIDRVNLAFEENRQQLQAFSERLTTIEATKDASKTLNPFCYYTRALHYVSKYQYDQAIFDLERSSDLGKSDLGKLDSNRYATAHIDGIENLIRTMLVSSQYFQGVCFKNLGKYQESFDKFRTSLELRTIENEFEDLILQSKNYLLQVLFMGGLKPFTEIANEYKRTAKEYKKSEKRAQDGDSSTNLKNVRKAYSRLKINEGSMYLQKSFVLPSLVKFKQFENADTAITCFWEAYDAFKDELSMFSLAQAMEHVGSSQWRNITPKELFGEVLTILKKRVAEDPDQLYSVTLYYMMSISATRLNQKDSAEVYLSQARHCLKEVPSYVTCFSPINRIRLKRSDLLEEMDVFEKSLT